MGEITKNNICFLEVQFHHERGPIQRCYFELFFSMVYIFTMPKINLRWGLVQPFLNFDHDLALFAFWRSYEICLVQNWGHSLYKKCKIVSFGRSLSEKQPFTFELFLGLKILLNSLTYSVFPHLDHFLPVNIPSLDHFILCKCINFVQIVQGIILHIVTWSYRLIDYFFIFYSLR